MASLAASAAASRSRARALGGALRVAACLALGAASTLLVAATPSYDPWSWLLWGREIAHGTLSTDEGPAFKPLTVALCAALAPLGSAAPWAWVVLVRAASVLALWLAFDHARRLAHGRALAGWLAVVGIALCASFPGYVASGQEPGLLLACALGGWSAHRCGRDGAALAGAVACALLRVEAWPFVVLAGWWWWTSGALARPLLAACAVAVPALWFGPELWGSGDLLRSGSRALVPNPGQPALAEVPALASLGEGLALALWPLWLGVAAAAADAWRRPAARAALGPAAAGLAWVAIVAALAQAGFSGEARYAMPGIALIAITGAVGLAAALPQLAAARGAGVARAALALALVLVAVAALPRALDLADVRERQAYQRALTGDLADAIALAGGREAVLACGAPIVGDLRGPMTAYRLDVEKHVVDFAARAPGVVFRSRISPDREPAPEVAAPFVAVGRAGLWEVLRACRY